MVDRSWFFASQGQQQGPYPEAQVHQFIASGRVTAETLVWTEGMAGWQKAGEIPGLMAGAFGPRAVAQPGAPAFSGHAIGSLSIEFEIWEFTWRSLLLLLGLILVIPTPWVIVWYLKWLISRVHVPGRPNLSFTGES